MAFYNASCKASMARDLNILTRRGRVEAAIEMMGLKAGSPIVVYSARPLVMSTSASIHAPPTVMLADQRGRSSSV
jgi:hypothetical protein